MIGAGAAAMVLTGCGGVMPGPSVLADSLLSPAPGELLAAFRPADGIEYLGIGPAPLGEDLTLIQVSMRGARSREDIILYADCGIAGYGVLEGLDYARHIRTSTDKTGSFWTGDAVYTLSPERPEGVRVIETSAFAEACERKGIPTV